MLDRKNLFLIGSAVVLSLVIGALAALVVVQIRSGGSEDEVAVGRSSSTAVITPAPESTVGEGGLIFEVYDLADNTCATADGVDHSDPSAVAQRFMEISFCVDSMVDRTMTDGMLRADGLMSQRLRETLVEPERSGLQRQWIMAQEHRAYTRPTVTDAATEPLIDKSGQSRFEQKMVNWLWVGRDGASMDGGYASLQLTLVQEEGRWVVDAVETRVFEEN